MRDTFTPELDNSPEALDVVQRLAQRYKIDAERLGVSVIYERHLDGPKRVNELTGFRRRFWVDGAWTHVSATSLGKDMLSFKEVSDWWIDIVEGHLRPIVFPAS